MEGKAGDGQPGSPGGSLSIHRI